MPARKVARQQVKKARRNRSVKTETRTIIARANRSLEGDDTEAAHAAVMMAVRSLDRAVRRGILHKNNAARRKSRMIGKLTRLQQAAEI